jgi:hypothetical protein
MKKLVLACVSLVGALALGLRAEDAPAGVTTNVALAAEPETLPPELQAFKDQVAKAHPQVGAQLIAATSTPRKVAIFARNRTMHPALNEDMDSLREQIAADLAAQDMMIVDAGDLAETFRRYKVTTAEERTGLVEGLFTGGSSVRMGQMLGVDYIILVSVSRADRRTRDMAGATVTTYEATLNVRVLEAAQGTSVFGSNYDERYPVNSSASSTDDTVYYRDLMVQAAKRVAADIASSAPGWRKPGEADMKLVSFRVSTTIDKLIDGLEQGTRAPVDMLNELRRTVGGVTVELDGATVGSSPGEYRAAPGLHQLRVTRAWMKPWQGTVNIQEGSNFDIALELSEGGVAKWRTVESAKAAAAVAYAEAAYRKGIKINFDTSAWREISLGGSGRDVHVETQVVEPAEKKDSGPSP